MKLTVYYPLRVSCNCRLGGREDSYSRRAFLLYHNDTNDSNISADRMPTSEQETSESEKTTEKWEGACASPSAASDGAGGGDARVPPELRAALPNVVWSRQEEKPDADGHQEIAHAGGFQPMRVPKPQLLRDVILNECRDREVRSASDGDYHRFAE